MTHRSDKVLKHFNTQRLWEIILGVCIFAHTHKHTHAQKQIELLNCFKMLLTDI